MESERAEKALAAERARIRTALDVALARPAGSSAIYSRREIVEILDRVLPPEKPKPG